MPLADSLLLPVREMSASANWRTTGPAAPCCMTLLPRLGKPTAIDVLIPVRNEFSPGYVLNKQGGDDACNDKTLL